MVPSKALADAERKPYWLDRPIAPEPLPPLTGDATADLAVVGGGFTGLWTALMAKERDEAERARGQIDAELKQVR
ncbi:hypothetical protein AB0J07_28540, partial [Microbispora rosea]